VIWKAGKAVLESPAGRVLGPIGTVGNIIDLVSFLNWVWEKQLPPSPAKPGEPFAGTVPRTYFDLNSGQVKFWWPEGGLTDAPRDFSLG
jgi:hypothetical protein